MKSSNAVRKSPAKPSSTGTATAKTPANDVGPARKGDVFGKDAIIRLADEMAQSLFG